jgi:signal transduction histidine kinase/ligand-binding sensor domain-containing protein
VLTQSISVNASRFVVFWLLMLFAAHAAAVDADKRITQYAHMAWRTRDGFFSGSPRAITQTTDGYIWIATQSELFQFDGVRLMKWTPSGGGQFPSSKINALLGSSDGSLWIATDSGLAQWKNQQLTVISGSQARISWIIERANREVWFSRIPLSDQSGGVCRVSGQQAQCFGPHDGIPVKSAAVLSEDRSGYLWFGDQSKVVQWNGSSIRIFAPPALKGNQADGLRGMVAAPDGSVWLGFNIKGPGIGLQKVVGDGLKPFVTHELNSSTLEVTTLLLDRQNSVWVGTISQGIFRIHGTVVDHYGSTDGLSSDYILQLYEDREGDVWAATSRGIDCFRDLRVTSYTRREGLPSEEVDSVLASRDGTIWAGGPSGLSSIRGRTVTSIQPPRTGTRATQVTSLLEDHAGRIWVGLENSLYVYDRRIFHSVIRPDGRQPGFVVGLAEDSEHSIWAEIIGARRALLRISNLVIDREFREPEMPAARKLVIAPDGSLWLGLLTGDLARYKEGNTDIFRFKNNPTPTRDSAVNEVVVATDGSVLGATSFGLIAWKNGTQQTMTTKNGLPCDAIYSAVTDRRGTLWLYAQCGIVEVANAELQKWWKDRNAMLQVRTIGPLDGAQPGPVPFQGAAVSPDGRVWFANGTALQVFDTSDTSRNSIPPPVYIQDVVAGHKTYDGNANTRFPAGTRDLQIDYTALSFRNPQKVAFRYRLEGRDNIWQDAGSRRQAFYTDLPPGQYRFRVIASNNDGVWNEQGAMLAFSIAPAWYQTKIFKFGCVLFAMLLVWTIHRVRVRQVAQAIGARFDERLAERTRIARDLHDTLLQTIQGSKLVADDALERSSDPGRMRKALEQLSAWLQQAGQEGRAALNSLRVSATTTNDLAEAFKRVLETTPIHSLAATISVSGDVRDIHPIVRDEVYRVGYEAIRNAHAHSGGNHLEVQLRYADDLTLRIRDNGTGADTSTFSAGKEGHYGVRGMRERAGRIGAKLNIVSDAKRGTEVCLIVPGKIAFHDGKTPRSWAIRGLLRRSGSD